MAGPTNPILAPRLANRIERDDSALFRVVIELDQKVTLGAASARVQSLVKLALDNADRTEQHILSSADETHPYLVARLQGTAIVALAALDRDTAEPPGPVIANIRPDSNGDRAFNPDNMIRSVISVPMLHQIEADPAAAQNVMIEISFTYAGGRAAAKDRVWAEVVEVIQQTHDANQEQFISEFKSVTSEQYLYARLSGTAIRQLVEWDQATPTPVDKNQPRQDWRAIYHIWPDFTLRAQIWRSAATIKADACRRSFATTGRGIVWAVFDSGIDGSHPHFSAHSNLVLPSGMSHFDFTGSSPAPLEPAKLTDEYGHGTHVAGIIAGELDAKFEAHSLARERDQDGKISYKDDIVKCCVMGVAPECKLLSCRVLDKLGEGTVSNVIAAIQKIQELNGYGRNILVHGVNMSLGYDFDPEWFACGQSPICVEVDRLVRSGVAVVVAAGNTGKGFALTINDPGNAELAVTVGATHRDMPHRYGVSYFSSKGPTGDGRPKPDLLAPGEKIVSCGAGPDLQTWLRKAGAAAGVQPANAAYYLERSGTSMAAPHVSGIIAGILSTRGEFVGLPEEVKSFLVQNATDLGRDRNFQGGGLVDMMRAIQAV